MAQAPHRVRYTRAEYIAFERSSNVKHEYLDGVIYAMAGGTPEHAAFAVNVSTLLSLALRDRPCRVHSSDLRIRVVDTGLETYPNVTVLCGRVELDAEDRNVVVNPIVVVEVTSPSTEEYDRGEKLEHYKRIPSLQEIVLVGHRERLVEVVRREDDGRWTRHEARTGGSVEIASLACKLSVDEVYRDPLAVG
jgi:Uma2 family endonuclease